MKRWIDRWNAYWFPTTTTRDLAICRILAVSAQLFWFFPSLGFQLNLLEHNSEFIDPQLFIRAISAIVPREVFFTPSVFTALYYITIVAGVTSLVGLLTRPSLFVLTLGLWILIAHKYSYHDIHHPEAVFVIFLMALAFAPSGKSLSLDAIIHRRRRVRMGAEQEPEKADTAAWPLKLAHVLLAMTYFSTGATKLIAGGLQWMNGYTLQSYTFGDAIRRDLPLGMWLGQQHTLAIVLQVFTIFIELFFFLSLIFPRTAPFFFLNALLFQIGLLMTAGHPFFQHMVLLVLLLFFLDSQWWRTLVRKYLDLRSGATFPAPRPASRGSSSGSATATKAVTSE